MSMYRLFPNNLQSFGNYIAYYGTVILLFYVKKMCIITKK